MLSFTTTGEGPPLVLLHGTNTTRRLWAPVLPELSAERRLILVDLPGHGESPPTSYTAPEYAVEVAALMDHLALESAAVAGLSIGGWTALELAKLGRATGVLAMVPAGLWARRSPFVTDLGLRASWRFAQLAGRGGVEAMRTPLGRSLGLRMISAHPRRVSADAAMAASEDVLASRHFPEHFRKTRALRFTGGASIERHVPVHVVWGAKDRVARARTSQHTDQLPPHAQVETWPDCGHVLIWDAPERVVAAALALPAAPSRPAEVS